MIPAFAWFRQLPASAVAVGNGFTTFVLLLTQQLRSKHRAERGCDPLQCRVAIGKRRIKDGLVLSKDGVEVLVLRNGFQHDVGNSLIDKVPRDALQIVLEPIEVELRCQQALTGNGYGDAACVRGNPTTPQLFRNKSCCAAAASWIEY